MRRSGLTARSKRGQLTGFQYSRICPSVMSWSFVRGCQSRGRAVEIEARPLDTGGPSVAMTGERTSTSRLVQA